MTDTLGSSTLGPPRGSAAGGERAAWTGIVTPADAETLVSDAVRAPSIHNTQPWLFRVVADGSHGRPMIEVSADSHRMVEVIDPTGRALRISIGAAVQNLRLSILCRLGREPVTRIVADADAPARLATVAIGGPREPTVVERRLAEAIPVRRTSRAPFDDRPIPAELKEVLSTAARVEGAELRFLEAAEAQWVGQLTAEAERERAGDAAYRAELERWTTDSAERRDGVPVSAFGPHDRTGHIRDFGRTRQGIVRAVAPDRRPAHLALLSTRWDDRADQVRAGQAMQRVLLAATAAGLGTGILQQATELPDLRRLLRDPGLGFASVQIVLRLGWPLEDEVPAAPVLRRDVADVLEFAGDV